jgi:beta-glucosidase
MAVQALRATVSPDAKIGYAPAVNPHFPMTESQEDIDASYEMMFAAGNSLIGDVSWWMDPVFLGHYPESGLRAYFPHLPHFPESDMDVISQPVDFLAYNCYTGQPTRASSNGPEYVPFPYNHPMGSLNWLIKADDAIYWGCRHFTKRYGDRPIYITENGFCGNDWVDRDGRVRDGGRIDFTRSYLLGLRRAASEGINVAGYYHWSLMDNFEWAEGYKPRFGLIHIDWETQQRTLKDSAIWYSKVIASNGGALDEPVAKLIEG